MMRWRIIIPSPLILHSSHLINDFIWPAKKFNQLFPLPYPAVVGSQSEQTPCTSFLYCEYQNRRRKNKKKKNYSEDRGEARESTILSYPIHLTERTLEKSEQSPRGEGKVAMGA
ncbi:hypothetical protein MCOR25_002664 [Pyricularia grisea]|nr:hypothetical protein MCOR25_002664 [Pyricularia grisea]